MHDDENELGLGYVEVDMAAYLAGRVRESQQAAEQVAKAEALGRPVWEFTDDTESAAELLEVRAAVFEFRPRAWWRDS
jgi:hypothetical protein